jgi:low affinity Fe/Cu permease
MLEIYYMIASNVILILSIIFLLFFINLSSFKIQNKIEYQLFRSIIKINIQKIKVGKQKRYFMIYK